MTDRSWIEFLVISRFRMTDQYLPKLLAALECLTRNQLWSRTADTNSIGGIVLHMLEHLKRHAHPGSNGVGIEEFFPDDTLSPDGLARLAEQQFAEWALRMDAWISSCLSDTPVDAPDLFRTYHLIEHCAYHLGQAVDRTRQMTGVRFDFCRRGLNEKQLRTRVEHRLRELGGFGSESS
ncbi:hypothetical protein [Staphylospora marina]|uniref:hypothetical protein n=1 Tax=Staphylospora marina TaxID=2490858 RepID=UPI000F5C0907|nr:hypothetical protein [Staphylospora marina]